MYLYARYIAISFRSQMQYRASFVMQSIGQLLFGATDFLAIWTLFDRFGALEDWRLPEVALFYGMVNVAYAITDTTSRGFDALGHMVRSGDFDRLLLRPRSTALQLAGQELTLRRIGRLLQGLAVLFWAVHALDVAWSLGRVLLTVVAILGGTCLFYGLIVLQATLSFWTIESLEIMNAVTYGGREAGMYPLTIYRTWFRRLFTFVVPLACVSYFPALAILGRDDTVLSSPVWFRWSAPLAGVLFLVVSLQVWKFGIRHYRSTGS